MLKNGISENDISNYNENGKRPLPIGKNKKISDLFKGELNGKIMTEFVTPREKHTRT